MSDKRYPGNIITSNLVDPTANSAKGVWSLSEVETNKRATTWPTLPDAPTIGTVSSCGTVASVPFTVPNLYGSTLVNYTATSTPGCLTATASGTPVSVSGMSQGTSYTFKVKAITQAGTGACSSASNSVSPPIAGQQAYTTSGSYCWTAPSGVTSISIVAVGGGGGGRGGGTQGGAEGGDLRYKNNISVSPGSNYAVVVGAGGAGSTSNITCGGNSSMTAGSTYTVGGGGSSCGTCNWTGGGDGGSACAGGSGFGITGGAGAGGYSGDGGRASYSGTFAGSGGGGGSGQNGPGGSNCATGGGGVGLLGQGSNGSTGGGGGSGGQTTTDEDGGAYGGGGSGAASGAGGDGGVGAVRIIWPGTTRSFPSTCTGDV
jgi:hypothetical protein